MNIVITGASTGIGAAAAEHLSSRGDSVVIVARRVEALREVADRCHGRAVAIVADVTVRGDVERVVNESIAALGHIDVWINNVGQGITRMPSELTDEDIDEIMRVNVKSALYGMQAVLPHFRARGTGQIINVSSMLGRVPFAVFRSGYCGAKHFLNALTATFREELRAAHPGITVSLLSPGVVRTGFGLNARHGGPDSRQLPGSQSAEEVAAAMAWMIDERITDGYTSAGSHDRVAKYYDQIGADPNVT